MARACVAVGLVLAAVAAAVAADGSCSDQPGNPCTWVNSCDTCDRMAFTSLVMHAVTGELQGVLAGVGGPDGRVSGGWGPMATRSAEPAVRGAVTANTRRLWILV